MLVFVSDLHITDHQTGVQHLNLGAFAEALPNIARQAEENGAEEVTFVFLGDIFDVVRTDFWTNLANGEGKPWDMPPNPEQEEPSTSPDETHPIALNALKVLQDIVGHPENRPIFELWSQPLRGRRFRRDNNGITELLPASATDEDGRLIWPFNKEPRRVYIPGNHDRIVNQFVSLRKLVIQSLGLHNAWDKNEGELANEVDKQAAQEFSQHFADSRYRVFARHGHEWDHYNFEHVHAWKDDAALVESWRYHDIPIGELLAAEGAGRLPQEMNRQLKGKVPDKNREEIVNQVKTIDDVRPITAILPWMLLSLANKPEFAGFRAEALEATIEAHRQVANHFAALPFVDAWAERHDTLNPLDHVDKIQLGVAGLRRLSGRNVRQLARLFDEDPAAGMEILIKRLPCLQGGTDAPNYEEEALADLKRVRQDASGQFADTLFILYGHTHQGAQVPLETTQTACSVYLNTGTWRPLVRKAWASNGFMRWKNLTYTIFYSAKVDLRSHSARTDKLPMFETWTGSLLAEPSSKS